MTRVRPVLMAAVPTPFAPGGEVDLTAARKLYAAIAANGVDGLFVAGTTGEFLALTADERMRLIEAALEVCPPSRVVAHVGTPDGEGTAELVARAVAAGAEHLAVVTPFQAGEQHDRLLDHYQGACAAAGAARTYAYVYPRLSGTPVSPETMTALAAVPGLSGAKISGLGSDAIARYAAAVPPGFELLTGNDRDLAAAVRAGASGAVSGVSSVFPEPFLRLLSALELADPDAEVAAQSLVDEAVAQVGPSIALLKLALELRGLPGGQLRVTAGTPAPEARERLAELARRLTA